MIKKTLTMKKTNNKYNFQDTCPSTQNYENYINNTGDQLFINAFNKHLANCELCNEAMQGYKNAGIKGLSELLNNQSEKFSPNKKGIAKYTIGILKYAASIIILLGITAIYLNQQNSSLINSEALSFDYNLLINSKTLKNKTLVQKTNEQFIYINSCNKIAYNDQFLTTMELQKNLKFQKNIKSIRIEVATSSIDCAQEIINSIKNDYSVPVITISSSNKLFYN